MGEQPVERDVDEGDLAAAAHALDETAHQHHGHIGCQRRNYATGGKQGPGEDEGQPQSESQDDQAGHGAKKNCGQHVERVGPGYTGITADLGHCAGQRGDNQQAVGGVKPDSKHQCEDKRSTTAAKQVDPPGPDSIRPRHAIPSPTSVSKVFSFFMSEFAGRKCDRKMSRSWSKWSAQHLHLMRKIQIGGFPVEAPHYHVWWAPHYIGLRRSSIL